MSAPELPPAAPEPIQERGISGAVWAALAIGLGVVLLLGAAGGVFWMARARGPTATPSASSSSPSIVPPSAPLPGPLEVEATRPRALPVPKELPGLVQALNTVSAEATALIPMTSDRPGFGAETADVTVALFGNLEEPHTREALGAVFRVAAGSGAGLRFAFFHAQLGDKSSARDTALQLARATAEHGANAGFRVLHRAAESSEVLHGELMERWISDVIQRAPERKPLKDATVAEAVSRDERLAALLAIRGTPTLFLNGSRLEGVPSDGELEQRIAEEARAVRWLRAQGVAPEDAYLRRLRRNLINVEADAPDRECVSLQGSPAQGDSGALLTIVEFSDFGCSHCRTLWAAMQPVLARHRPNIRRFWRTFSTSRQPGANRPALVALAARAVGGDTAFWAAHDALFREKRELNDRGMLALAQGIGLGERELLAAIHDPRRLAELERDERLVKELGLLGAPTVFLNGRRLTGAVPTAVFSRFVEEELAASKRIVRAGTPPTEFQRLLCGTD